jgi:hypothetical protein
LLAVLVLVGCAPAATPEPAQPALVEEEPAPPPAPTATVQPDAAPTEAPPEQAQPTEAPSEVPQVAATSRGPNLEASDPATYARASGGLQLVEFFAFW